MTSWNLIYWLPRVSALVIYIPTNSEFGAHPRFLLPFNCLGYDILWQFCEFATIYIAKVFYVAKRSDRVDELAGFLRVPSPLPTPEQWSRAEREREADDERVSPKYANGREDEFS